MRFLANENFPRGAVIALEKAGHDILWMRNAAPGASDANVLARAVREQRILLTFDKDFGELARGSGIPRTCGIVLFRMSLAGPGEIGKRLADVVSKRDDWAGHFSLVEPGRIRMRPLP
jgi:predicted nuclease of predicted toxin-antitoxin system